MSDPDPFIDHKVDLESLRRLYESDSAAKRVFRDLAQRQRNYGEIKVNRTAHRVGAPRREVIRVFRQLQAAGCGQFVVGRGGWPSRFVWDVGMIGVARAAAGQDAPIDRVDPGAPTEPEEEDRASAEEGGRFDHITHTFQLRAELPVTMELPADLTTVEAARLADFVRTLPFQASD